MNSFALPSLLAARNTILMDGALATVLDYKVHVEEKEQWIWKKLIPDNFVRIPSIPEHFCFHEYFMWYASEILLYIKKIFKSILYSKKIKIICVKIIATIYWLLSVYQSPFKELLCILTNLTFIRSLWSRYYQKVLSVWYCRWRTWSKVRN